MSEKYYVQLTESFDPVDVELSISELSGVKKLLVRLSEVAKEQLSDDILVNLSDSYGNEIFDNYNDWNEIRKELDVKRLLDCNVPSDVINNMKNDWKAFYDNPWIYNYPSFIRMIKEYYNL